MITTRIGGESAVDSQTPAKDGVVPVPPRPSQPAPAGTLGESPFDASPNGIRRPVRWTVYAGVPLVALVAVLVLRTDPERTSATTEHNHAVPATQAAGPVMLSADAARRIGVTYATATIGSLAREVRSVGQVTFDETRVKTIALKVDGWVERLYVDFTGQAVNVGDPLLSIYSPMMVSAQEELVLARRLAADVASGTPDAVRGAEELVRSAQRRLAYWDVPQSEIDRLVRTGEVQRAITVRARVGGVVVEKAVLAGQRVMAGDALYRVADLGEVWLEGEIYEQDLTTVRLGLAVTAELEAYPGEHWSGRIAYVYPTLNPETRTARVRVELANPGLRLKPGMYATFRFTGAARAGVLSVPRSAILSTGERSLVFVRRDDGMLEPREVRISAAAQDHVEVLAGLRAGEVVVASATFLVDAESNLKSALGGMGNMPGMDMTSPPKSPGQKPPR
jgi:membrane fusion protein, copper/silver efflux system